MNLPVLGATGVIGVAQAPDQPAVPGFAHLVTALLAGSDVISAEVAQSGDQPPTPPQEGIPNGPTPDEEARVEIGHDAPLQALMVHPSLVADALIRHLDQVGILGLADETPVDESPPIGPAALARPVAPFAVPQALVPPAFSVGTTPLVAVQVSANPREPSLAVAPPPQPSTDPADAPEPALNGTDEIPGDHPSATPPAEMTAEVMAPPAGSPISTPVVATRPSTNLAIDPTRPTPGGLEGLSADRSQGAEPPRGPADRPADIGIEIEPDRESRPTVASENHGEAAAIPPDRTQRDADPARIGMRPAEALSTAARRVEEAVRRLEAAPPPSVVTMVIEELDLRLTVAIRPDGIHLSAPGPEAPLLIRSLEEALHSRGFDLSGRHRGRPNQEQPEAPVIPSAPRPTTRPTSGLRL